jgi:hypothetical protein
MRVRLEGPGRQARVWAAAFAVAAAIFGMSASTALAVPVDFWGVAPQAEPSLEQLQRLKRGGVESIRAPIAWNAVQPTQGGPLDWSGFDALVRGAASAGIDVLPFVMGAPEWAVPSAWVPGSNRSVEAPRHLPAGGGAGTAWAGFLTQAVARYGPNGSFWAENPEVPKRPIRVWQIWNEENFKYFVVRPNPAEYGKLVKISYGAIKGADPGAKVVLGGMFARPREGLSKRKPRKAYMATEFLSLMLKSTPGIASKFVGVALHPYSSTYQYMGAEIAEVRAALKKSHDARAGLWITELGWSSQPPVPGNPFAKGPAGQAAQLKGAFSQLLRNRRKWLIQRVYWFSVDDEPGSCNFCDGSGLFGAGFTPKPSWYAYVKFAGGTP